MFTVFSRSGCMWCKAAEAALRAIGYQVDMVDLDGVAGATDEMHAMFDRAGTPRNARPQTVPQIFAPDGQWIGGFEALMRHLFGNGGGGMARRSASAGLQRNAPSTVQVMRRSISPATATVMRYVTTNGGRSSGCCSCAKHTGGQSSPITVVEHCPVRRYYHQHAAGCEGGACDLYF